MDFRCDIEFYNYYIKVYMLCVLQYHEIHHSCYCTNFTIRKEKLFLDTKSLCKFINEWH